MDESFFRLMGLMTSEDVPEESGLYCIRMRKGTSLLEPFGSILTESKHNILYIGKATIFLSVLYVCNMKKNNNLIEYFKVN